MKRFLFHTSLPPMAAFTCHYIGLSSENAPVFTAFGLLLWMLYWWIQGTVSIGITALVPLLYLPVTGLIGIEEVSSRYANPIIFLFLGGFMLAIALEKYGIHTLMAKRIVKAMGFSARQRVRSVLISAALLSMWISNTATALIMLPIAVSFSEIAEPILSKKANFHHRLFLAIAVGANIGGMATLVGTPPNLFFSAFLKSDLNIDVNFFEWMTFGVPTATVLLVVADFLLLRGIEKNKMIPEPIEAGKLNLDQKRILLVFSLVAFFWISKPLWGAPVANLHDAVIAFAGIVLLQLIPRKGVNEPLLVWRDIQQLPWDIVLLFGGGLSLALALQTGGVFAQLELFVTALGKTHIILSILVFCLIGIFLTEIMSNIAMVAVLLPLILELSSKYQLSFFYIALPLVLGASCAFMLPIATPPNAIVFGSKRITVKEMMNFGLRMNIASVFVISSIVYLLYTWKT